PGEVEVVSIFDKTRSTGYMPMLIRMRNGLGEDVSWNFKFSFQSNYNDGGYDSNYEFKVKASSEIERLVVVPMQLSFMGSDTMNLSVDITSTGFASERVWWSARSSAKSGYSSTLPTGRFDWQTQYEAPMLPSDWRAYVGLDALAMTDVEWESLDA